MNEINKCPNCGAALSSEDEFCPECGAKRPVEPAVSAPTPDNQAEGLHFGAGSRTNVAGNISHSSTHQHTDQSVHNTSHVDQSVNSTTILMNEKAKEYCGVCGQVLDDSHARCPQCGKDVCNHCLVPGKNRCQKCEKQAINDFRMFVKQTVLVSNSELSLVERDMISQRAIELDVEDQKDKIIDEVLQVYRPVPRPQSMAPSSVNHTSAGTRTSVHAAAPRESVSPKGVGVLNEHRAADTTQSSSKSVSGSVRNIVIGLVVVVCVGIALLFLPNDDSASQTEAVKTVQKVAQAAPSQASATPAKPQAAQARQQTAPAQKSAAATPQKTAPVKEQPAVNKPAEAPDGSYTEGMKAYESNDGLKAVNAFKKSGSAKAYYMLGIIYKNGCGNVVKNPMLARKYFKKAAKMGSTEAENML